MKRTTHFIFYTLVLSTFLFFILTLNSCKEEVKGNGNDSKNTEDDIFELATVAGNVANDDITEASGIVASKNAAGFYWVHNDGGAGPENRLFLMDASGKDAGTVWLKDIENIDWEDLTIGAGPEEDKNYLYVGQIGDNRAQFNLRNIYRIEEPTIINGSIAQDTVKDIDVITYKYPDGPRDAETLMIDPLTKDLYIISKREPQINIYVARYPQSTSDTITLEKVGTLGFTQATAGDISADGTEILIKNYTNVFYWQRAEGQSIEEALEAEPTEITYQIEPQGEAITFAADGSGFFTLSEEAQGIEAILYYYPRVK